MLCPTARHRHDCHAQLTCIVCIPDCLRGLHPHLLPHNLAISSCSLATYLYLQLRRSQSTGKSSQPICQVQTQLAKSLIMQRTVCMQVAAVDKPKVHLWETGITRITRHPQNTGQLVWCLGHLLWIGNSFMLTTSAALVAHHVFACYHGDFRLERKHGKVSAISVLLAFWLLCTQSLLV